MRLLIRLCTVLLFGTLIAPTAFGAAISFDPTQIGIGARPLALGRAYSALADDASAIFINPSGLASQDGLRLISMYSSILDGNTYLTAGAANKFQFGTLGLGFINVASPNIEVYEWIGGVPVVVGYMNYNSSILLLSYANTFRDVIQLGGSLKIYSQGFSSSTITNESSSGLGYDADLGIKFHPRRWLSVGLCAQNFIPSSMSAKFTWTGTGEPEDIPSLVKIGLAVNVLGKDGLRQFKDTTLKIMVDYDTSSYYGNETHLGLEFQPVFPFTLRLGSDNGRLTAGAGFANEDITFDYAYRKIEGAEEKVTHAVSVGYVGGMFARQREEEKDKAEKRAKRVIEIPVFVDVPNNYYAKEPIEKLAALGIISGFADGKYYPDKPITRAELALFLSRCLPAASPPVKERIYKDVPLDFWAAPFIKTAVDQGWITGYQDKTFRPNWPVSQKEAGLILARFDRVYVMPQTTNAEKEVTRAEIAQMLYGTLKVQKIIKQSFIKESNLDFTK
ncbi:MAG: S-layer homology domain-containing protein [Candidatus Margulisbacteria bacterium]|nr:S-layer homology domain-containing protein [Candidatus Margulisiibacteriota bacterium]